MAINKRSLKEVNCNNYFISAIRHYMLLSKISLLQIIYGARLHRRFAFKGCESL